MGISKCLAAATSWQQQQQAGRQAARPPVELDTSSGQINDDGEGTKPKFENTTS
jgi:hypothetical protein